MGLGKERAARSKAEPLNRGYVENRRLLAQTRGNRPQIGNRNFVRQGFGRGARGAYFLYVSTHRRPKRSMAEAAVFEVGTV